jgi:hypothetical protein
MTVSNVQSSAIVPAGGSVSVPILGDSGHAVTATVSTWTYDGTLTWTPVATFTGTIGSLVVTLNHGSGGALPQPTGTTIEVPYTSTNAAYLAALAADGMHQGGSYAIQSGTQTTGAPAQLVRVDWSDSTDSTSGWFYISAISGTANSSTPVAGGAPVFVPVQVATQAFRPGVPPVGTKQPQDGGGTAGPEGGSWWPGGTPHQVF